MPGNAHGRALFGRIDVVVIVPDATDVSVIDPAAPGAIVAVPQETPSGRVPPHDTATGVLKPRMLTVLSATVPDWPAAIVSADGPVSEKSAVVEMIFTDATEAIEFQFPSPE
jgi:hypothetical protein